VRGRRPKPTRILELEGSFRAHPERRRKRAREPKAPAGVPPCPKHLRRLARATWNRIGGYLAQLGVLTPVDQDALELLVRAYVEYHRAQSTLERCGATYTIRTASGRVIRSRPEVAMAAEAWKRVLRALTEFGLTPSSRVRLETTPPAPSVNPHEEFIFGTTRRA
jgi:P27 family predicted phage terminase small subunit